MYDDLDKKVAVVTGGSKGLGSAIAVRFGREGMSVVVNYHTDEKGAERTVSAIEEAGAVPARSRRTSAPTRVRAACLKRLFPNSGASMYGSTTQVWKTGFRPTSFRSTIGSA